MRLLVTRPCDDAGPLAARLRAMGHEVFVEPLLSVRFYDDVALPVAAAQALLVTSANGVRALARRGDLGALLDLRLIAVGAASATAAREAGFRGVDQAEGDVEALAALAAQLCDPQAGRLIHVSGQAVAGDLKHLLETKGFEVERVVLYEAVAADRLSEETARLLGAGALDGILFYSARTARIFRSLAEALDPRPGLERATGFCLAPAVGAALSGAGFGRLAIAARPSEDAMLDLVGPAARPAR